MKRADTLTPKNAKTLRYLGYDYLMTKQYSEAVAILEQVIDLTPNSALAYGHLARAYWLNGQKPQALDAYSAALRFCRRDDECDESWAQEARDDLRKALTEVDANNPTPLKDAYGYTIQLPSVFGTYYDTLDSDGTLRINTPGNGNDIIAIDQSGSNVIVGR